MEEYYNVAKVQLVGLMTKAAYCDLKGWMVPVDENPTELVYVVDRGQNDLTMVPRKYFEAKYSKVLDSIPDIPYSLKEYQTRVITEAAELNNNIEKLTKFIRESVKYSILPDPERLRLHKQLNAMQIYLSILISRITNFK